MKKNQIQNLSTASLWSRPDPVLAQAGLAGEFLVAKIRLSLATLLLLIPLIDSLFFPGDPKEALVGLSLSGATFILSAAVYIMLRRDYNPKWLSFASTSFDVTLTFERDSAPQLGELEQVAATHGYRLLPASLSFNSTNTQVAVTPLQPLPDATTLTITIAGVEDLAGNPVAPFTSTFTTSAGADTVSPSVIASSVLDGDTAVPVNTAVVAVMCCCQTA